MIVSSSIGICYQTKTLVISTGIKIMECNGIIFMEWRNLHKRWIDLPSVRKVLHSINFEEIFGKSSGQEIKINSSRNDGAESEMMV